MLRKLLLLTCVSSLTLTLVFLFFYSRDRDRSFEESHEFAAQAAQKLTDNLEKEISRLDVVNDIVAKIEQKQLTDNQIEELIYSSVKAHPELASISVSYPSHTSEDETTQDREFRSVNIKDKVHKHEITLPSVADYKQTGACEWFWEAIHSEKPFWSRKPDYCQFAQQWRMAGYSLPFRRQSKPNGVITAWLSVDRMRKVMYHSIQSELGLLSSDASYGAIVNSEGQFLCHPEIDFVINARQVSHFGEALETVQQIADLPKMSNWPNFRYLEEFRLTRSNQNHFLVFSPISSTGSWIMIALDEHRLYNRPAVIHRNRAQQIQILIAALIFLVSFVAVVARVDRGTHFSFWVVSWTIAGASLLGMIFLWMLNITSQDDRGSDEYRLTNHAIVAKQLIRLHTEDHLEITSIPTGVHIQSIQFLEAYNVKLTGYIWQSYSNDLPEWIFPTADGEPGFVLPEAEELEVRKALNHRYEDREVFVWYFETVLRQSFQFDRYPFDQLNVWLRLWPRHFDRAVVLTPDLDSYYTLDPKLLPGIEQNDFVLEGWHLNENYFSYRTNRYNSDFGMQSLRQVDQIGYPELYFNVTMRRNPLTPFIANVIPQLVVALLLFSVALTIRTDESKSQLMGFNTNTVLGFNAALFFVVIIGHVSLRENLDAEGITYLEWLYFISYLAILGVTVNALMAGALRDHFLVRYGDNLLIRQTYWPLYMGSLFLISLWTFS